MRPTTTTGLFGGGGFLPSTRLAPFLPSPKSPFPEYIENRIKENTTESMAEAQELAYGNTNLLTQITQARDKLEKPEAKN